MGKFFKFEDAKPRTFVIDTTGETIARPMRPVTAADMIGAVLTVDDEECTVLSVADSSTTITATFVAAGDVAQLIYTKATDAFALGEDSLDNVMVDEFGRVRIDV